VTHPLRIFKVRANEMATAQMSCWEPVIVGAGHRPEIKERTKQQGWEEGEVDECEKGEKERKIRKGCITTPQPMGSPRYCTPRLRATRVRQSGQVMCSASQGCRQSLWNSWPQGSLYSEGGTSLESLLLLESSSGFRANLGESEASKVKGRGGRG